MNDISPENPCLHIDDNGNTLMRDFEVEDQILVNPNHEFVVGYGRDFIFIVKKRLISKCIRCGWTEGMSNVVLPRP